MSFSVLGSVFSVRVRLLGSVLSSRFFVRFSVRVSLFAAHGEKPNRNREPSTELRRRTRTEKREPRTENDWITPLLPPSRLTPAAGRLSDCSRAPRLRSARRGFVPRRRARRQ